MLGGPNGDLVARPPMGTQLLTRYVGRLQLPLDTLVTCRGGLVHCLWGMVGRCAASVYRQGVVDWPRISCACAV